MEHMDALSEDAYMLKVLLGEGILGRGVNVNRMNQRFAS